MIRTGTRDDIEGLLALWRAADAVPSVSDDPESIEALIARDPESLIVAEDGGAIVGSLIAGWDGWRATFYRLAVHPSQRRRGLALLLVAEGERRMFARGARKIGALVVSEHDHAVGFWRAAGYGHDDRLIRFTKQRD